MDPLTFLLWRFYYFHRDPQRHPPSGPVVVAPADGRVLYVKRVLKGSVPNPTKCGVEIPLTEWVGAIPCAEAGTLIGIYMTPLSVHYNRAPIAGRVKRIVGHPNQGENLSMSRAFMRLLWNMQPYEQDSEYVIRNARNTVLIEGAFPVIVVQIADRQVDQIDCFVSQGDEVAAGDKLGMIRMGSQCDLFIPDSAGVSLDCRPGDRAVAGETVLGRYELR